MRSHCARNRLSVFRARVVSLWLIGALPAVLALGGCGKTALEYVEEARAAGSLAEQEELLSRALTKDPSLKKARSWRAEVYKRLGEHKKALADFDFLLEHAKTSAERANVDYRRGEVLEHEGKFAEAVQSYTTALKRDPRLITSYAGRAGAYFKMGKYAESMQDYLTRLARDVSPGTQDARERRSDWRLCRGIAACCAGEWTSAGGDFEEAIKTTRSKSRRARAVLGLYFVACRIGDKREADGLLSSYALATLKDYRNTTPWIFSAVWYVAGRLDEKQFLQASKHSNKAVQVSRTADAHYYIGAYHLAKGEKDEATEAFKKCVERVEPRSPEYHLAKVELRRIMVGGKTAGDYLTMARQAKTQEKKLELYTKALRVNPSSTDARLKRAHLLSLTGKHERAVEDYTKLLSLYEQPADRARALRYRAWTRARMGDHQAAVKDYAAAVKADPESWRAREGLAVALCYLQQYKQAAAVYGDLSRRVVAGRADKRFWVLQRSFAMACASEWQAAADGFRSLVEKVGDSPVMRANLFIVECKLEQRAVGVEKLEKYAKKIKTPSWDSSVVWHMANMLGAEQLLKASAHSSKAVEALQTSRACYYIGSVHWMKGERRQALESFKRCEHLGRKAGRESWEYRMAIAELGREKQWR